MSSHPPRFGSVVFSPFLSFLVVDYFGLFVLACPYPWPTNPPWPCRGGDRENDGKGRRQGWLAFLKGKCVCVCVCVKSESGWERKKRNREKKQRVTGCLTACVYSSVEDCYFFSILPSPSAIFVCLAPSCFIIHCYVFHRLDQWKKCVEIVTTNEFSKFIQ